MRAGKNMKTEKEKGGGIFHTKNLKRERILQKRLKRAKGRVTSVMGIRLNYRCNFDPHFITDGCEGVSPTCFVP